MSSFVESSSEKQFWAEAESKNKEDGGGEGGVSSELVIKPAHDDNESVEALDKEAVLRRIRHQKRLNKLKSAVQALFDSNKSAAAADADGKAVVAGVEEAAEKIWVDDPFSTL